MICASKTSVKTNRLAPVQRFPVAQARFVSWSIDVVGKLPRSARGNCYILTMVDHFSRWLEAAPIPSTESETIAQTLVEYIICRYGVPHTIHSDRGSNFLSDAMKSLYDILKIKKTHSSPYHPASNGKVEIAHKFINNAMKAYTNEGQTDWDIQLPYALLSYRASFHKFTGDTPAFCVFGTDLDLPIFSMLNTEIPGRYKMGLTAEGVGAEVAHRLSLARERFLTNMDKQTTQSLTYANKTRKPVELEVGKCVLFRRPLTTQGKSKKLHRYFTGPFRIIEQHGDATFTIKQIGGRRTYRAHADNLFANDEEFRRDVRLWAEEAQEIFNHIRDNTIEETTPPLEKIPEENVSDPDTDEDSAPDPPSEDEVDNNTPEDPAPRPPIEKPIPKKRTIPSKTHFTRSKKHSGNLL